MKYRCEVFSAYSRREGTFSGRWVFSSRPKPKFRDVSEDGTPPSLACVKNQCVRNIVSATEINIGAPGRPNAIVSSTSIPRSTHAAIFTASGGTVDWSFIYWTSSRRVCATEKSVALDRSWPGEPTIRFSWSSVQS